jgi:hypothetical protein
MGIPRQRPESVMRRGRLVRIERVHNQSAPDGFLMPFWGHYFVLNIMHLEVQLVIY